MFAQTNQVHKALLNYYEQRWVLKDDPAMDTTDSMMFLNELRKENEVCLFWYIQVNANVCQLVVQLVIVGLNSLMSKDIEKQINKRFKNIYNQLKMALIF
jgi:hypothetical protein